jgi:hypothetical protein
MYVLHIQRYDLKEKASPTFGPRRAAVALHVAIHRQKFELTKPQAARVAQVLGNCACKLVLL